MTFRPPAFLFAIALVVPAVSNILAADDPSDRWLHAFVLLQTGHQLGKHELWPLAHANYVTALESFEELGKNHPEFQPELVEFRIKDLKESITAANEAMNVGDHDIAMLYAGLIEVLSRGEDLRYSLKFEESYPQLALAEQQLEDIIERRPDDLGPALARQREYLRGLVDDTREEILQLAGGATMLNEIEQEYYLTGAITLIELPENPEIALSAALFPDAS